MFFTKVVSKKKGLRDDLFSHGEMPRSFKADLERPFQADVAFGEANADYSLPAGMGDSKLPPTVSQPRTQVMIETERKLGFENRKFAAKGW